MNFSERLIKVRKDRGYTQATLSKKLGIRQQQYSRYECGTSSILVINLKKICEALDISSEYLLGFIDKLEPINCKYSTLDNPLKYYNERISFVRVFRDFKQIDVANYLGIFPQQYNEYEKGLKVLTINYFRKICEFLNISPDYILGLTDEMRTLYKEERK